ncbi:MAG: GNAT family N-acetyltransferase [Planctomycetaceae bacterium]|nr:MAG: GNAT family N-acetyltransferase [Planctomycetaceae bacterium]
MSITTYYLEMRSITDTQSPELPHGLQVMRASPPRVTYYRFLYDAVGRDWNWIGRKSLGDDELRAVISDPANELFVLYDRGSPVGFAELDLRITGEIELKYFGLFPDSIGRGWGRVFLASVLWTAWQRQPRRVWLHTCTEDHPRALDFYLRAGFVIYDQECDAHA